MADRKPGVLIVIPTQGWVHFSLVGRLPHILYDDRYAVTLLLLNERPVEHARNHAAAVTREMDVDYLLMIDADNPPLRNPLDLVELDKDIIGCPTPMYKRADRTRPDKGGIFWNVMEPTNEEAPFHYGADAIGERHGLAEVSVVGTGCILIARRVVEVMPDPFVRTFDRHGLCVEGSDLTFCTRAKELGFKVWVHYDYPCLHHCRIELSEIADVKFDRRFKDDIEVYPPAREPTDLSAT